MPAPTTRGGLLLALAVALFACASPVPREAAPAQPEAPVGVQPAIDAADPLFDDDFDLVDAPSIYDPFEEGNRAVYRFNRGVDRVFWDPLITGYRFLVPGPARRSVRRVFKNLNSPVFLVNNLLQGRFVDSAETLGAFLMNSTLGWGGLFDAGKEAGLEPNEADFGQTLAMIGVGSGPYVMIPALGPTNVRDGLGFVIDRAFQPLTYIVGLPTLLMWGGGVGLALRDESDDKLKALQESSVDPYSVLRSAYTQNRAEAIRRCCQQDGDGNAGGLTLSAGP